SRGNFALLLRRYRAVPSDLPNRRHATTTGRGLIGSCVDLFLDADGLRANHCRSSRSKTSEREGVMNDPSVWGDLRSRYESRRPRCLLALDGGGIRGVMTLGILKRIEEAVGQPLWQYFDYIAGTSTGAIIAAALARGLTVDELLAFYQSAGP